MFDLTSTEDASENCRYAELAGEPQLMELNFIFPPERVIELFLMEQTNCWIDKIGVVGKNVWNRWRSFIAKDLSYCSRHFW